MAAPYPAALLDAYLATIGTGRRPALAATAIRAGADPAELLLARAAGSCASPAETLAAARAGDVVWFHRRRHRLDPAALADLAGVLALRPPASDAGDPAGGEADDRDDRGVALALYELVRTVFGSWRVPPRHQGLHAQLAFTLGRTEQVEALLRRYVLMPGTVRAGLRLDLRNPFVQPFARSSPAGDRCATRWLRAFQRWFGAPSFTLGDDLAVVPFDRLIAAPTRPVPARELITVVVTCYRPAAGLLTAVRSLLSQSWSNVEIIVVDDASPAGFQDLLDQCGRLDDRVRVIGLAANGGTYRARNAGIDAASGDLITFQDSDDWSHPRRLERQARPLLADAATVASLSDAISVTDHLVVTRPGHARRARLNPSSLMFRRDRVVARLGYFDDVRKGADSEMIGRIRAVFGRAAVRRVDTGPQALVRLSPNSLSGGEVGASWLHPARAAYVSAYRAWHVRIAAGRAAPYRKRQAGERPFAAPLYIRSAQVQASVAYDVVFATDWRVDQGPQRAALDEIGVLAARGMRVGVTQIENYRHATHRRRPLSQPIQQAINGGLVDHVQLTDALHTSLLIVRQPSVLQFAAGSPAALTARQVLVVADEPPVRPDGTDQRYTPLACADAVYRTFGVEPLWSAEDPGLRAALLAQPGSAGLGTVHLPSVVRAGGPAPSRVGPRTGPPRVGWEVATGDPVTPPVSECLAGGRFDVRLRHTGVASVAGVPAGWLAYAADDIDVWGFLHQLDFFLPCQWTPAVEARPRPVLEALAAGCVVVAPRDFAGVFGGAAIYCDRHEVARVLGRLHRDPAWLVRQAGRAQSATRALRDGDGYAEAILRIVASAGDRSP